MSSTNDPSLEELRARAELSRAALAANVTELRGRISRVTSPTNLKAEARTYLRHEREGFIDSLRDRAAENPLQAAAVAAAVAYPALSIVRAIPLPLMLIGAGLFLTTKRGQDSSAAMKVKMNDAIRRGTETVTEMTDSATSRISDTVSDLRAQATAATGELSAAAGNMVPDAAELRAGTQSVQAKLTDAVQDVSARAIRARGSAARFASENAVMLGGLGAIAGAFLAASFPMSDAENRVLGPGKRRAKDAARATAVKGMEKAGAVVAEVFENVASTANREGLDGAGLQQTVQDLTEKARAVAERSVDAALGNEQQQRPLSERNPT